MKDHRVVALSLALLSVFFFFRAAFAYWAFIHIVPVAEVFDLPYNDPGNAERFAHNLRFSIWLFGSLGLVSTISGAGVIFRQHWVRWVWLVTCTVMTFSYLFNFLVSPQIAMKQYDIILVCVGSWLLLRGNGLSRRNAP